MLRLSNLYGSMIQTENHQHPIQINRLFMMSGAGRHQFAKVGKGSLSRTSSWLVIMWTKAPQDIFKVRWPWVSQKNDRNNKVLQISREEKTHRKGVPLLGSYACIAKRHSQLPEVSAWDRGWTRLSLSALEKWLYNGYLETKSTEQRDILIHISSGTYIQNSLQYGKARQQ